ALQFLSTVSLRSSIARIGGCLLLRPFGNLALAPFSCLRTMRDGCLPKACCQAGNQDERERRTGHNCELVPSNRLLEPVRRARWPRDHRFAIHKALYVHRQPVSGLVTPCAVFFQALHCDPIEITPKKIDEPRGLSSTAFRRSGSLQIRQVAQ